MVLKRGPTYSLIIASSPSLRTLCHKERFRMQSSKTMPGPEEKPSNDEKSADWKKNAAGRIKAGRDNPNNSRKEKK